MATTSSSSLCLAGRSVVVPHRRCGASGRCREAFLLELRLQLLLLLLLLLLQGGILLLLWVLRGVRL